MALRRIFRQLTEQPEGAPMRETYLTVTETAEYLNTSVRFVRRMIADRRVPFHHMGRHVRFALTDLDAWIAAGRVEPITREQIQREMRGVA